jgi:hypothetical protein
MKVKFNKIFMDILKYVLIWGKNNKEFILVSKNKN